MRGIVSPKLCFVACKMAGFSLLFAFWAKSDETAGFFLLLFLIVMSLLRLRAPGLNVTVAADIIVCTLLSLYWSVAGVALAVSMLEAIYLGYYWATLPIIYSIYRLEFNSAAMFSLVLICGFFLNRWNKERRQKLELRDAQAGKYYELEGLQRDLMTALAQIEQMTAISERSRIARDIHDNAGHEIIAAYMSLQAIRTMLHLENGEVADIYDAALDRLDSGVNKIREAVHNMSSVTFTGAQRLADKCGSFPACKVDFKSYGNTEKVPIYVWSMLESCLNESLTNIYRHSSPSWVTAELDVTPHIVRLCVMNDGAEKGTGTIGNGLRNLRHRAAAIGGSISVESLDIFTVICVVPIGADSGGEL